MYDEQKNIIDLRMLKITGFYQLIDPGTAKHFGLNWFRVGVVAEIACGFASMAILAFSSAYHWRATNELMSNLMGLTALVFTILKKYRVWRNADAIWNCLDVGSVDFLSRYRGHDRETHRRQKAKSVRISRTYFTIRIIEVALWLYSPFSLRNVYLDVDIRGRVQRFRYNSLNYVFPVTDTFYNEHFYLFYTVETLQIAIWCQVTVAYDPFVISVCIAIESQLKTIARSYGSLCYDGVVENAKVDGKIARENDKEAMIQLKLLIQDQQNIFRKIKEIYGVFRPVTFVHIAAQSTLITLQTYMIFINYYNGLAVTSAPITKLLITVIPNVIHLYMTCKAFGDVNYQKDTMNFALYSSNWTAMSIEYKKMLLYTMRMNDAEMVKLQISLTKIINLEMFASVMRTTYNIISLLAKSYRNTTNT